MTLISCWEYGLALINGGPMEAKVAIANPIFPEEIQTVQQELVEAILQTAEDIEPLNKDAENRYGKYNYVPIDTYYEMVASRARENGLTWVIRETGFVMNRDDKKERSQDYICVSYAVDLYHKNGLRVRDFDSMTVIHPIQGAQTSGSARSYADKMFMRGLFKVVTGEHDADATDGSFLSRPARPPTAPSPPRKPSGPVVGKNEPVKPLVVVPEKVVEPEPPPPAEVDIVKAIDEIDPDKVVVDSFKGFEAGSKYPILSKPTVEAANDHPWDIVCMVFEIFAPCAQDIDELTAFWMDNKTTLKMMEQAYPDGYRRVLNCMSARKIELT